MRAPFNQESLPNSQEGREVAKGGANSYEANEQPGVHLLPERAPSG